MASAADIADKAEANFRDEGVRSLSVFASSTLDLEGIVREARSYGRYLPHGTMQTSTAGRVREAGFELVSTPPPPGHYSLMIPDDYTDAALTALMRAFDAPVPTPQGRMR